MPDIASLLVVASQPLASSRQLSYYLQASCLEKSISQVQLTEKRVLNGQPSPSYSTSPKKIAKLILDPALALLSRLSSPLFQLIQLSNPTGKVYFSAAAIKIIIVKQSIQPHPILATQSQWIPTLSWGNLVKIVQCALICCF